MDRNTSPLISIIIPTYNTADYLPECLDSILAQTYHNIEVYIVEDHSTDNGVTLRIAQDYAQAHPSVIHVVRTPANSGIAIARNLGLKHATGQYVMFVDSDDKLRPEALENLLREALRHNADIVKGGHELLHSDGAVTYSKSGTSQLFTGKEALMRVARNMFSPPPARRTSNTPQGSAWATLFKMELLRYDDVYFPDIPHFLSEDLIFLFRALRRSRIFIYDSTPYYCYRYVASSVTHKVRTDMLERAVIAEEYYEKTIRELEPDDDLTLMHARGYLIGTIISSCNTYLLSATSIKDKRLWFHAQRRMPVFKTLYEEYPWRKLPWARKMGFICFYKGRFWMMYGMLQGRRTARKLLKPFLSRNNLS